MPIIMVDLLQDHLLLNDYDQLMYTHICRQEFGAGPISCIGFDFPSALTHRSKSNRCWRCVIRKTSNITPMPFHLHHPAKTRTFFRMLTTAHYSLAGVNQMNDGEAKVRIEDLCQANVGSPLLFLVSTRVTRGIFKVTVFHELRKELIRFWTVLTQSVTGWSGKVRTFSRSVSYMSALAKH